MNYRAITTLATGLACATFILATPPRAIAQAAPADPVFSALTTGTPAERAAVAKSLAALGPKGAPALVSLVRAMEVETDEAVVGEIFIALAKIGLGDATEVDELVRILKTKPDTDAASRAAIRLVRWAGSGRPEVDRAIPTLIASVSSKHLGVRAGCAISLGALGARAQAALPALTAQLKAEPEVEGDVNAKSYLIGAIIQIYAATDPLCGAFAGDNGIGVESNRDHTGVYYCTITLNGNEFKGTAPVATPAVGTFKTPDGAQFPFKLTPTPDGVQLESGNSAYRLKRQTKPTG